MLGRVNKMAETIARNPEWVVKLNATSVSISTAVVKLVSYHRELSNEKKKDKDFYNDLKQAFIDCADIDEQFSEAFSSISKETDSIWWELNTKDE